MQDVNIFEVTKDRPEGEWASFKNVGDKVQGVYIGNRESIDSYNNEQIIYELLDKKRNKIINVAIRKSKKPVVDIMSKLFFGQIIGFVYDEDKKTKDGKSTFKSISVREDPKIFDAEVVADMKARSSHNAAPVSSSSMSSSQENDSSVDEAFENINDVPFMSEEDYLKGIAKLAREKLGVTDSSLVKDRVMEATDLAFTKANYEEIFNRLLSM